MTFPDQIGQRTKREELGVDSDPVSTGVENGSQLAKGKGKLLRHSPPKLV